MRLLITGATGLIGRRLVPDRLERGDALRIVSRDAARARAAFAALADRDIEVVEGDPARAGPWQRRIDGCDGVVHLAGANVASRRWSPAYKDVILASRTESTRRVVEGIEAASHRPEVLVCASAVGWYGDTGDRETGEDAAAAQGDYFADLAARWERAAAGAEASGTRVVSLRIGLVLDERGGLVGGLVRPFRMFVGGPIGSGAQYMPWIHWRDLVGLIDLALRDPALRGPVNATAPNPVTNRVFSRALGKALGRPSWLPLPSLVLRIVLGEIARYAVMSQRVVPSKAIEHGYRFEHAEVGGALDSLFRRSGAASG